VIAGILLLRSERAIRFINERLAGLMVPDHVASRIIGAEDPVRAAVALAIEQARWMQEIADGVHIMPLGLDAVVPEIVREAGLR
jgi:methylenetetrahydrofolate reductase (NADPH)